MTHHTRLLIKAYVASDLSFLGISFEAACGNRLIRMGLEGWVRNQSNGKPAPVQPALI
jgi:acylphosphatase